MKAISLWQPWATLWVLQIKKFETRGWPVPKTCDGVPLAIHAAQKRIRPADVGEEWYDIATGILLDADCRWENLPYGALVGVCDRIESLPITNIPIADLTTIDDFLGNWESGRHYWIPDNMRKLPSPILFPGHQSVFNIPDDIIDRPATIQKQRDLFHD